MCFHFHNLMFWSLCVTLVLPFLMVKPPFSAPGCRWSSCNAPAGTGRRPASAGTSQWRCSPEMGQRWMKWEVGRQVGMYVCFCLWCGARDRVDEARVNERKVHAHIRRHMQPIALFSFALQENILAASIGKQGTSKSNGILYPYFLNSHNLGFTGILGPLLFVRQKRM